jgi:hypothetical protein
MPGQRTSTPPGAVIGPACRSGGPFWRQAKPSGSSCPGRLVAWPAERPRTQTCSHRQADRQHIESAIQTR